MGKTAVVLFNLGGPDRLEAVEPFLFNLFNDRAIISVPQPLRWLLAKTISRRRAPIARGIYRELGGGSPLVANTKRQAIALSERLKERNSGESFRCFTCMRYWHPMSAAVAADVRAWEADRVVLLPLYPQFSTTTTGSSLTAWSKVRVSVPTVSVCCYPAEDGFVSALADRTRRALSEAGGVGATRVLFSAHGLPKKVILRGDPYQWQVERTAAGIVERLAVEGLDWQVCYQSRVGPLEWVGPYTDDAIRRAGSEGKAVVVVPVAFVSEHSETLVELDMEYRSVAETSGVPRYIRVGTVSTDGAFIDGLASAVEGALARSEEIGSACGSRICPGDFSRCAMR